MGGVYLVLFAGCIFATSVGVADWLFSIYMTARNHQVSKVNKITYNIMHKSLISIFSVFLTVSNYHNYQFLSMFQCGASFFDVFCHLSLHHFIIH